VPIGVEVTLLHALDDRWGISPPWGAADSGCDLKTPGDDVLRGWAHVDLGSAAGEPPPTDVPVSALLRGIWDSLELFGTTTLTGVEVIVPLACAGERLWERVAGSILRDDARALADRPQVLVQARDAWTDASPNSGETDTIAESLSEFVQVSRSTEVVNAIPFPPAGAPSPFAPYDADLFRAEVRLPDWTIEDAAWLVEAVALSCSRTGVGGDIQVAVRVQTEA
jgi:hypothetical protein